MAVTRGLRSTAALLLVLVGLGAYIYFVTWKQADSAVSKQEKVFPAVSAQDVQELTVKSEAGEVSSIKRAGEGWELVAPVRARASEPEVSAITGALAQLEVVRVVDENPADLKEYGLATPRLEMTFKGASGKPGGTLLLGDKTATGANLYAKRNDEKRVFLVSSTQDATFNKSPFDLRDKALVTNIQRDKLDGLDVDAEGKVMQFAKSGTDWSLTKPLAARADFSAVEGLLGRIETAQIKSVASEAATPAELKTYGLDKPAVTVVFRSGSAHTDVAIGGKANDATVYARDLSKPTVVTIEKAIADDLRKGAEEYRRKDVFEFRAFNATHVEVTHGGAPVVFERTKGQGDAPDKWRRLSPSAGDVDKDKLEGVLANLADIRATSFVAKAPSDAPAMVVDVKFDEGKRQEHVTFVKSGADVFVVRPDEPGAAKIDAPRLDEALKALDPLSK